MPEAALWSSRSKRATELEDLAESQPEWDYGSESPAPMNGHGAYLCTVASPWSVERLRSPNDSEADIVTEQVKSDWWWGDGMSRPLCWIFHKAHWMLAGRVSYAHSV